MNLNNLSIASIDRLIAHEIYPKSPTEDAYAVTSSVLLTFSNAEKQILINRVSGVLANASKTFKLEFEDISRDSVYTFLSGYSAKTEQEFIDYSIQLANNLADAHFRTKIPGGFCLIGDGLTSTNAVFFFVIKAELQEVFNIQDNSLMLIKDVFLSPAKDFYKIGFFIKSGSAFEPFMYDDQFSLQKKDLTEYFYGKFLGLTTDRNDKLKAKNFYEDTKNFIDRNIDNVSDRVGLVKALNTLYREDTTGIISPRDFSDSYFEGDLKSEFMRKIVEPKFPHSFTKDTSLIDNRLDLQRISIPLSFSLSIIGSTDSMDHIEIIEEPNTQNLLDLQPEINNGSIRKIVVLKERQ